MKTPRPIDRCLCGSGSLFADCCGSYLDGAVPAPTAVALMRSRYVAYALEREPYLLATWHESTRPASLDLPAEPQPRWIRLAVMRDVQQGANHAQVEFVAHYKLGGRAYRLHETSRFVCEGGRWFYIDGDIAQ